MLYVYCIGILLVPLVMVDSCWPVVHTVQLIAVVGDSAGSPGDGGLIMASGSHCMHVL